jgi:hypothetical protein
MVGAAAPVPVHQGPKTDPNRAESRLAAPVEYHSDPRGWAMADDPIELHTARALAEIELARAARSPEAAEAHLRLSALHLDKVSTLSTGCRASGPASQTA